MLRRQAVRRWADVPPRPTVLPAVASLGGAALPGRRDGRHQGETGAAWQGRCHGTRANGVVPMYVLPWCATLCMLPMVWYLWTRCLGVVPICMLPWLSLAQVHMQPRVRSPCRCPPRLQDFKCAGTTPIGEALTCDMLVSRKCIRAQLHAQLSTVAGAHCYPGRPCEQGLSCSTSGRAKARQGRGEGEEWEE